MMMAGPDELSDGIKGILSAIEVAMRKKDEWLARADITQADEDMIKNFAKGLCRWGRSVARVFSMTKV